MCPMLADPVNSTPSQEVAMTRVTVHQGEPAELPCVASGFPLPTYSWSRDGDVISSTQERVVRAGGNLVFRQTMVSDSGTYTCVARNDIGQTSSSVTLSITGRIVLH